MLPTKPAKLIIGKLGITVAEAESESESVEFAEDGFQTVTDSYTDTATTTAGPRSSAPLIPKIVIVGRPNVGKSSLFNRLLQQDRAIVTDIPGTTRDLVSETADFNGIPVRLVDTAGLRATTDTIERLGIDRTYQALADADLTLVVLDSSAPRLPEDDDLIAHTRAQGKSILAANKSDLAPAWPSTIETRVSATTGQGIEELRLQILQTLAPHSGLQPDSGFITSARHAALLRELAEALAKARFTITASLPHELLLVDLYGALQPLGALTGSTTADDILHRIFSTFCIGK